MTAEDRIHVALLLALCAANAVALSRPSTHSPADEGAARAALTDSEAELSRAELDAAIGRLQAWLERARSEAPVGGQQELALRGLGPTPEDRSNPERWLSRLLGPDMARGALSNSPAALADAETRTGLTTALVILLEAGVPTNQPLAIPAGEQSPGLKLGELVQRLLDRAPDRAEENSPWQLDLLSLAVLGGMRQYQDRLARTTQRELRRLDQEQRSRELQPGAGDPTAEQLEALARDWRAAQDPRSAGTPDLHWSAAVFRGSAVLNEPPLTAAARQHLRALLGRYRSDRALYRYLEATARDPHEHSRVQLGALENIGRFEEALYNAHLTFQRGAEGAPGAETAHVMRLAARDLIDRWQSLESSALAEQSALPPEERARLLRAAVHALRGLRTARVAG